MELYNGNLKMNLPIDFIEMTEKEKIAFFPSVPIQYGFINPDRKAIIGMLVTEDNVDKDTIEGKALAYQQLYARMIPGFQMGQLMKHFSEKANATIMTYKSNAPDKDLFNLLTIIDLNGKLLLMVCTSDFDDAAEFQGKFLEIVEQFEVCK